MKLRIVKSENRTNTMECWNNYGGDAVAEFIRNHNPRFVDVLAPDGSIWEHMGNEEDTIVFEVPARPSWDLVDGIRSLNSDEFFVDHINGKHICRLWWD